MAVVITKCRNTGNHVFVAVEVHPQIFERSGGPFASSHCPFCDLTHCWFIEDSKLANRSADAASGVRRANSGLRG
jgi:hypothetical protein